MKINCSHKNAFFFPGQRSRLLKCGQHLVYSKTCVKRPLSKRPKIGIQDQLSLNACSKGSILQSFRPSLNYHLSFKIFVLSILEWPFYIGLTVYHRSAKITLLFVCLFDLILYVPSTIFQLNRDRSSWVEPVLS